MINVICVKWGNKYGPEYVNRLKTMVNKNLTIPHRFVCYTDDPKDLNCDIIMIPESDNLEIYWNKLGIFKSWMFKGTCIYFDLDTVIQDNVDFLLDYKDKLTGVYTYWNDMYTDETFPVPEYKHKTPFNSSVMVWNAEDYYYVWDKFNENPDYYIIKYYGDDKFLGNEITDKRTFPKGLIYSRLYGAYTEHDKRNDLVKVGNKGYPLYYHPDMKICMFNGPTTEEMYKRYEYYWND